MEWFKMRTIWGKSVARLSDAEAGRFIKAIYSFMIDGEEYDGSGREELMIVQALETLRSERDEFQAEQLAAQRKKQEISEKRRQAIQRRWSKSQSIPTIQNDTNEYKPIQTDTNSTFCINSNGLNDFVSQNKNKNKNIYNHNNSARAREKTEEVFGHLGSDYSDAELADLQAKRIEISDIEIVCRHCGMAFDPADEDIVRELLNAYSADEICNAVTISKRNGAAVWPYIEKVLYNTKNCVPKQIQQTQKTGSVNDRFISRSEEEWANKAKSVVIDLDDE